MKKIFYTLAVILALALAYFCFWPVPIEPAVWAAPAAPGYVGPHAVNQKLAGLQLISLGKEEGPEHVAIGPDGKLYVAVASGSILRMAPDGHGQEVFVNTGGRVLEYDPATKNTRVIARGLAFANGVALSSDGRHLFVNETGKYRVWKIAVTAHQLDVVQNDFDPSQARVLLDNLPGYPDNLMPAPSGGKIWMGLVKPRNPTIDKLAGLPFLRKVTLRLPRALWPIPKAYGHVVAFSEDGKILADLQDPSGAYPETTAVTETAERLYIQSLHAKGLGWLPKQ